MESYRRIRNTLRFLLANLADFDAANDLLPADQWLEIDRYALELTAELQNRIRKNYDSYEFHLVVQDLHNFCSEELGGFYLDILKDRLYTAGGDSQPRRAAQSALWHITHVLTQLFAPVLSFTADEVWELLSGNPADSVLLHTWYELPKIDGGAELSGRWGKLRLLRADVLKLLEELRQAGKIGSSLQAEVDIYAEGEMLTQLNLLGDDLRFAFITSQARVHQGRHPDAAASTLDGIGILAAPSVHAKCERCWHYRADVGADATHPQICGRCVSNLFGRGEPHSHA